MNIYIKSFNRPYFLDRCLETVFLKVKGFTKIIILDDGTPQKYLDRILEKFPAVEIRKSEFWEKKSAMIESGRIERSQLKFPGDFWNRETKDAEGYLLLLEDDFYLTEEIDLTDIAAFMTEKHLLMYKLMWHGTTRQVSARTTTEGSHQLLWGKRKHNSRHFRRLSNNTYRMRWFFTTFFPEKFYYKTFFLPFYNFYSVDGAVYRADYFSHLWNDVTKLNEYHQIFRSLEFYEQNKIELKVGKALKESVKTSWLTSATNEFPGIRCQMFPVNKILNDHWLKGNFDPMHNYPYDCPPTYIAGFLPEEDRAEFIRYTEEFKKPFRFIDCKTDDYGE